MKSKRDMKDTIGTRAKIIIVQNTTTERKIASTERKIEY